MKTFCVYKLAIKYWLQGDLAGEGAFDALVDELK